MYRTDTDKYKQRIGGKSGESRKVAGWGACEGKKKNERLNERRVTIIGRKRFIKKCQRKGGK